jgi:PPP family 3-phenylpropionic acid transporter
VGFYVSLGVVTRAFAGLGLPVLADRLGQRRLTLVLISLGAAALVAGHLLIGERVTLAIASLALGALLSGLLPLGEALGAGAALRFRFAYALPRAVGSVAFLIASLATGALVARLGADAAVWWIVVCLLLSAALALGHPGAGSRAGDGAPGFGDILRLLTEPTFALFVLASALCLSSHAVLYAYGSVHWRALGLSEDVIGALWAFSVAVEVGVMLVFGPRLMDRVGPIGALVLSALGGIVRWGVMMTDPTGLWLWVLQIGHSFTFVAGHLGAIAFIAAAVPERYGATAQGAFMGLGGGILTAIAMVLSAILYPTLGGATYGLALAMSAAGLLATLVLSRVWRGRVLAV